MDITLRMNGKILSYISIVYVRRILLIHVELLFVVICRPQLKAPGHTLEIEGVEEKGRKKRARALIPKRGDSSGPDEDKWVWTIKETDAVPVVAEVIYSTDISMPALSVQVYDSGKLHL